MEGGGWQFWIHLRLSIVNFHSMIEVVLLSLQRQLCQLYHEFILNSGSQFGFLSGWEKSRVGPPACPTQVSV